MRPQLFEQNIIREVRKYECLYRKDLVTNRSNEKIIERANAWAAIASTVGATDKECRDRWNHLRGGYLKVFTKARSDPEYKTDWKYSEAMSFMNAHLYKNLKLESIPKVVSQDMYSREMFEENLIEEVKKYELIYNPLHPEYKTRAKRDNVWIGIASSVGKTVQQCQQRWGSLREAYQKIILRLNDEPEYKTFWKYMDAMSFMKDHLDQKPKICVEIPDDEEFKERLLEEVQKYECIYNGRHPEHRKRSIKQNVWSSIAAAVGNTVPHCKSRWQGLRERYLKEYQKMTSVHADEEYTSNWRYTDAMSFMKDYISPIPDNSATDNEISKKDMFCRACMGQVLNETDEQCSKSYNIFQTLDLADKLMSCSNLQITSWDEYPHSVCEKCYAQILDFHQFQIMCRDSLDKFNEIQKDQTQVKFEYDLEESEPPGKSSVAFATTSKSSDNIKYLDNILDNPTTIKCENYLEILQEGDPLDKDVSLDSVLEDSTSCDQEEASHCGEFEEETANVEIVKLEENQIQVIEDPTIKDHTEAKESTPEDSATSDVKRRSRDKVLFKCDICPKTFYLQHCFDAHQRRHLGLSGYACSYPNCDRAYNRVTDLTRHQNEHKGISNDFKCYIGNCDKVFPSYAGLNYHKRKYHKCGKELKPKIKKVDEIPKTFVCEACGKVFNSKLLLQNHRLTHVDESQWPFVCNVEGCRKRFRMKYPWKVHMKRHTGVKNFVCPHCGMRKATRNELNIHINFHTFERKYPCRICSKVFKSVGMVSTHIHKVHEGQKPRSFPCRFCERQLSTLQIRRNHEKTHTGNDLVPCEECDKTFTSPQALKMHMNTHFNGEKPHACGECGKRFTFPSALTCHMKLHVESKPYSCEECGQGFRWPGSYYRHKKKHRMDKRKEKAQSEMQTDEDSKDVSVQESDLLEIVT